MPSAFSSHSALSFSRIMGTQAPFLFDTSQNIKGGLIGSYQQFDSKSATITGATSRVSQLAPLNSINHNTDTSYIFLPKTKIDAYHMSKSVKKYVNLTRKCLFSLGLCEFLCACILFIAGIIANPIESMVAWIIRLTPVLAMVHTAYAIYYLSCKKTARATVFSAYCHFFACMDALTIPFYIFTMLFFAARPIESRSMVSDNLNVNFLLCYQFGKYCAGTATAFYMISLAASLYLGQVYRRIATMPPEMNPMEDNLTSRHKRNQSSNVTESSFLDSQAPRNFEAEQISGTPSEDVDRYSKNQFLETKPKTSLPSHLQLSSHDAREDLPSRKMQVFSSRPSAIGLKRSSRQNSSYMEIDSRKRDNRLQHRHELELSPAVWYGDDSLNKRYKANRGLSLKKNLHGYTHLSEDKEPVNNHPNPLQANPPASLSPRSSSQYLTSNTTSDTSIINEAELNYNLSANEVDIGVASLDSHVRDMNFSYVEESPRCEDLEPIEPLRLLGRNNMRQVSSGHDYLVGDWNSQDIVGLRDGHGSNLNENQRSKLSGVRPRKFSGKLLF
ncbi:hypothetical protein GcM1_249218 [Golovinomyces cichoracearum]|uniref:Uncharacterized protein n=1 Tax=Golovinomyces cichoracearum TaxID=62708 RepID=A0A420IC66_9PEZI|nr:hypothetical protein GcM1_249218 [Golovinomyces cichoracearum]